MDKMKLKEYEKKLRALRRDPALFGDDEKSAKKIEKEIDRIKALCMDDWTHRSMQSIEHKLNRLGY